MVTSYELRVTGYGLRVRVAGYGLRVAGYGCGYGLASDPRNARSITKTRVINGIARP